MDVRLAAGLNRSGCSACIRAYCALLGQSRFQCHFGKGDSGMGRARIVDSKWGPPALPLGKAVTVLLLSIFPTACSLSSAPNDIQHTGNFEVTVRSNGREVKNFNQELVHHLTMSRSSLAELQDYSKREAIATPRRDSRGAFQGLKVRSQVPRTVLQELGIMPGDVVTAFGTKKVEADMSFEEFLLSFDALDEASLTFERKGEAHKVIYSLESPRNRGKLTRGSADLAGEDF